jgi:hypothetical protein
MKMDVSATAIPEGSNCGQLTVPCSRIARLRELLGPAVLLRWPSGSKGYPRKWKHLTLSDMTDNYFSKLDDGCNVGVALGEVSGGLVTIDFDEEYHADCFLKANPLLTSTLRTRGKRGCNIWIRLRGRYPASCKLKDQCEKPVGEWRADGCQTIVSGIHPTGALYRYVVEAPAVSVSYDQIIWPNDILLRPDATESKRVREDEVVRCNGAERVSAGDSVQLREFFSDSRLAEIIPTACRQNNSSLFKLARLKKDYETLISREEMNQEREYIFNRWAERSAQFWRLGRTRDQYYEEFLEACSYARIGLHENPLPEAANRARNAPLVEVPGFTSGDIRLLAAICRELKKMTGSSPFFVPTRQAGELLGVHWGTVARWLRVLEVVGVIHLAPGEVRKRGCPRSPRYHYAPQGGLTAE